MPLAFAVQSNGLVFEDQGRTPAGRWGKVEELGGVAVFLASAASSFVNGHILYVDGGMGSCV